MSVREHVRSQLPLHPIIAGVLTALSEGITNASPRELAVAFAVNLTISVCIGATLVALWVLTLPRFRSRWRWVALAVIVAAAVVIGTELALLVLSIFATPPAGVRVGIWQMGAVVSAVVSVLGIIYDRLRQRAREVELREQRAQQELLRARLENLQARLNPHFLFNSLNTLAALIAEDPDRAVDAVERLSQLLRYGLEGTKGPKVSLAREADAVRDYLELEQLRFGSRLSFEVDIDPDVADAQVPPLCLQPLVENAVKHGIAGREGGNVTVRARRNGNQLEVLVEDDGAGVSTADGTQTGEANLRERLRLTYGDGASLDVGPCDGGGYRAAVTVESA